MTPLEALRLAVSSCPAARGHVPDGLSTEGIANRLRTYGIDPVTRQKGTPEQIAQWRATLGTASGPYSTEQIKLDSAAYHAAKENVMTNQLQKLATMHAALVLEVTPLAQRVADVLALVEALGHQINAALASSDESPAQTFDQLGGFGFDRGPEPVAEMAVHVPSTVPPRFVPENYYAMTESEIMPPVDSDESLPVAHTAEFAPDAKELAAMVVTTDLCDKPGRKKTEYTAKEWAMSPHFLHLMKRQHPFNTWTAEQQNAKRDEFVASVPADEKMNRWGQRFAKFCGVST